MRSTYDGGCGGRKALVKELAMNTVASMEAMIKTVGAAAEFTEAKDNMEAVAEFPEAKGIKEAEPAVVLD